MIAQVNDDKNKDEFDSQTNEVSPLGEDEDSGEESTVEDQELLEDEPQRFRKTLTKNRLVHSIDSSLAMRNYNPIVYLNNEGNFEIFVRYLGTKSNKSMKTYPSDKPAIGGR